MGKSKKSTPKPVDNVFQDGPHLNAFLVCERVIEEKDGTKTPFRLLGGYTLQVVGEAEQMPAIQQNLWVFVSFKKGEGGREKHNFQLNFIGTQGDVHANFKGTFPFAGGPDRGVDIVMQIQVQFKNDGLYWLDLYLDDIRVSRRPIRVNYIVQSQQTGPGPTEAIH